LYASPNIFRMSESKGIRWVGHVARKGRISGVHNISDRKSQRKINF